MYQQPPCSYHGNPPMFNYWHQNYYPHQSYQNWQPYYRNSHQNDYGSKPFVVDIENATKQNNFFRTTLWTGNYLQLTLMSIGVGEDIGLEIHRDHDQFIRIEDGQALVQMGDTRDNLSFEQTASKDYAIFIPAGKWHNVTNIGNTALKVYSIYAPPEHPFGTVHKTKEIAMSSERTYYY